MSQSTSQLPGCETTSFVARRIHFFWSVILFGLIGLCYSRFFDGTYFSQDDFVWLCFSKFHPFPIEVLWTDSLCGQFFRPLGQLWWVGMHGIAGDRVIAYQLAILTVHLCNGALVSHLVGRLVSRDAGIAALPLFVMNPLFVARISPYYCFIFDTLGFLFFISSITLAFVGRQSGRYWFCVISIFAALAAYLTKEAYFTLPAALVLVLGLTSGRTWSWKALRQSRNWLSLHIFVWMIALTWRGAIIGGLGGYGLASPRTPGEFGRHMTERCMTLAGLTGWSLSPHLARWDRSEFWPVILGTGLWLILSIVAWRMNFRIGVWWVWSWIGLLWVPSVIMTTYAPVSFYGPLVGPVMLVAFIVTQHRNWRWLLLFITADFAIWSLLYFDDRSTVTSDLRQQHKALIETFQHGNKNTRSGDRVVLLHANSDLTPDPIIKYQTPTGQPAVDVLFVNSQFPVAWVVCNSWGPGRIAPMTVSPDYQTGVMRIGHLEAVPLAYRNRWWDIVTTGPPFRFFDWRGGEWIEISPPAPAGQHSTQNK